MALTVPAAHIQFYQIGNIHLEIMRLCITYIYGVRGSCIISSTLNVRSAQKMFVWLY